MNDTSTTSYCGAPITNNSYGYNIFYNGRYDTSFYEDFLDSFDKIKDKCMLMSHLSLEINEASKHFQDYLTDEELQEKQYKGRFWAIAKLGGPCYLYILVDNETVVIVDTKGEIIISGRDCLPKRLQGRYYDEC